MTDELLAKAAHDGFDNYWSEGSRGIESEAWLASAKAVAALVRMAVGDEDGKAFRTAARLGLTLRFYGGCAQSGMPGSPCAYEVVPGGHDRASAMRQAVAQAERVIGNHGITAPAGGEGKA